MSIFAKNAGKSGEELVAKKYQKSGYQIIAMNYRTRQGEIDVIAQKGTYIVLIEVKTRAENTIAAPREFVTLAKQQKLIAAAKSYMAQNGDACFYRFDVAEVIYSARGSYTITCIENAFTL